MEKIIKLWKELGVTHIDFEFCCGGDSMNDTTLNIHKGDEIIKNDELETFFDEEVYKRVDFYVNSDGHYQGESGNVLIELNNEGDDFDFMKSAQSEWCERTTSEVEVELTDEEIAFVNEFVADINGGESEGANFNYKKDFIINQKRKELIDSIGDKVDDVCGNFIPEIEGDGDVSDWYSYTTNEDDITDSVVVIKGNKMIVMVSNEYYFFTDSED